MRHIAAICLVLGLVLGACDESDDSDDKGNAVAGNGPSPVESVDVTPTDVPETPVPTNSPVPDPTATPEPTSTPQPTPTTTHEPEPTGIAVPTVLTGTLPEDCIDINTASREELRQIIHIDEQRSEQIINLRPFSSIDDLLRVNGIADERLQEIRQQGSACASSP